ncbi:metal ABC transporter ATP-binding protein [Celerinatantimonas diazotrophica]|uniref:Zinc transport system ATP-binding protein n=1 Tax=Celerinatantimonas diazotrophica TaxID=412034 RepID=A0A4R1K1P0_9GAMM|nr:ATP-binding cassette domain-containing protein [Celerinatantimonas diazotrophica]TCK57904.1 zinc transport system ATP-binding protein [Celerinatantimonas diazotrophica]CAG9298028.1 Vitamin B12 import ATP-binding protein BtuD [Celerinatantimonas diazotrophica]
MPVAVEFNAVSFAYEQSMVLKEASLELVEQGFLLVLGPNGGGKTTFAKLLLGLIQPTSGRVKLFEQAPHCALSDIGYVPQITVTQSRLPIRVFDVVNFGLYKCKGLSHSQRRLRVMNALQTVGLSQLAKRKFSGLSGGERQRVLIARALVSSPRLILLDEPTANVDAQSKEQIYQLLSHLNAHATIVLITHDPNTSALPVSDIAFINRQVIHHKGPELTEQMLALSFGTTVEQLPRCANDY